MSRGDTSAVYFARVPLAAVWRVDREGENRNEKMSKAAVMVEG